MSALGHKRTYAVQKVMFLLGARVRLPQGIAMRAWRHLGSSIVFLIGFLAIIWGLYNRTLTRPAGQYSDTLLAGVVMVFGALHL